MRIAAFVEPRSHKSMPFLDDDEGMDADALQARGHQQRCVDAGSHLLVQHLVGQPDALSGFHEVGRRFAIDDALSTKRLVNGSHLIAHTVAVLCLIGIERRAARPFLQIFCRRSVHG